MKVYRVKYIERVPWTKTIFLTDYKVVEEMRNSKQYGVLSVEEIEIRPGQEKYVLNHPSEYFKQ